MKTRAEKTKNKNSTNGRQEEILRIKEEENRLPESILVKLYKK